MDNSSNQENCVCCTFKNTFLSRTSLKILVKFQITVQWVRPIVLLTELLFKLFLCFHEISMEIYEQTTILSKISTKFVCKTIFLDQNYNEALKCFISLGEKLTWHFNDLIYLECECHSHSTCKKYLHCLHWFKLFIIIIFNMLIIKLF